MVAPTTAFLSPLLLTVCLASLQCFASADELKEVTVDAAFTDPHEQLILMSGHEYVLVKPSGSTFSAGTMVGSHLDTAMQKLTTFQAVYMPSDSNSMFLYGPSKSCHVDFTTLNTTCLGYKGRRGRILGNGGPDAISSKGGKIYVFKGCKYAIRHTAFKWSTPKNIQDLGLPCPLDAAWKNGTDMVVLQGDQLWWWMEDDSVKGPVAFDSVFTLLDWKVKPYIAPEEEV